MSMKNILSKNKNILLIICFSLIVILLIVLNNNNEGFTETGETIIDFAVKGDKGDKGDQGIQGEEGIAGPEGPQGPQGPPGDASSLGANNIILNDKKRLCYMMGSDKYCLNPKMRIANYNIIINKKDNKTDKNIIEIKLNNNTHTILVDKDNFEIKMSIQHYPIKRITMQYIKDGKSVYNNIEYDKDTEELIFHNREFSCIKNKCTKPNYTINYYGNNFKYCRNWRSDKYDHKMYYKNKCEKEKTYTSINQNYYYKSTYKPISITIKGIDGKVFNHKDLKPDESMNVKIEDLFKNSTYIAGFDKITEKTNSKEPEPANNLSDNFASV